MLLRLWLEKDSDSSVYRHIVTCDHYQFRDIIEMLEIMMDIPYVEYARFEKLGEPIVVDTYKLDLENPESLDENQREIRLEEVFLSPGDRITFLGFDKNLKPILRVIIQSQGGDYVGTFHAYLLAAENHYNWNTKTIEPGAPIAEMILKLRDKVRRDLSDGDFFDFEKPPTKAHLKQRELEKRIALIASYFSTEESIANDEVGGFGPILSSGIVHLNRHHTLWYLHHNLKRGKSHYSFKKEAPEQAVHHLPEGFQIQENPLGQVTVRDTRDDYFKDFELDFIDLVMKRYIRNYTHQIEVTKDKIIVWEVDLVDAEAHAIACVNTPEDERHFISSRTFEWKPVVRFRREKTDRYDTHFEAYHPRQKDWVYKETMEFFSVAEGWIPKLGEKLYLKRVKA